MDGFDIGNPWISGRCTALWHSSFSFFVKVYQWTGEKRYIIIRLTIHTDFYREVGSIVSLLLFLSLALWEDYHAARISNRLIVTAFLATVLNHVIRNGFHDFFHFLLQPCVLILILFPLYLCRALGAGDLKLLGVTALFLSWKLTFLAFLTAMYFALIPVIFLLFREKKCLGNKIPMSGPILGGVLLIMLKEGYI